VRREVIAHVAPPLLLAALFAAGALALTAGAEPTYEARARLDVAPIPLLREFEAALQNRAPEPSTAGTPLEQLDLGDISVPAADARRRVGGTAAQTADLSVRVDSQLREIETVALARDARTSAALANAFAEAIVNRRNVEVLQRRDDLEHAVVLYAALGRRDPKARSRAQDTRRELLRIESAAELSGGGITIARPAVVPRERASPRIVRDAVAAALLGLLLGLTPALAGTSWPRVARAARERASKLPLGRRPTSARQGP
jgi:hypothetical protein